MQALEAAGAVGSGHRQRERRRQRRRRRDRRPETSYAYTASHTGALLRLAQIAEALGARARRSEAVPEAVARVLAAPGPVIVPPARLVELIGAGPNAWTAQEGALKIRESAYVATEGLSSEQFLHGPSVALDEQDTLVVLDGGGPGAERTQAIAGAMEVTGARVVRIAERDLGEPLSIFPLTVWVQRIAVELAEARGVSPDRFRYEEDPRREAGDRVARVLTATAALRSLPRLPIETPRLRLRPLHPADLAALHAIQSREDVCRWLDWGPRSRDEVREALEGHIARLRDRPAEGVVLAVVPVTTGELVGYVSLAVGAAPSIARARSGSCCTPITRAAATRPRPAEAMLALAFEDLWRAPGRRAPRSAQRRVRARAGEARDAPRGASRSRTSGSRASGRASSCTPCSHASGARAARSRGRARAGPR